MTARYPSSGGMMPAFIITGSTIMAATCPRCSASARATALDIVERHHDHQIPYRRGDSGVSGYRRWMIARTDLVGLGQHRHLHRVVVAVIAALDLDDQIASGQGAGKVDRVHGGLGAGVGEAPQRKVEATGQLTGYPDGVLGRLREVRAATHPVADRFDDRRMRMPGNGSAVAAVHVDVLVAVDVVDLRAAAVAHPDGLRLGDLPVGRRAAGEVFAGLRNEFRAARLTAQEHLLLVGDQLVNDVGRAWTFQPHPYSYEDRRSNPPLPNVD